MYLNTIDHFSKWLIFVLVTTEKFEIQIISQYFYATTADKLVPN